ncbi:MAG: hypothetical protein HONBIEJF_02433 [Fimbriimonadaceae bacterium]|nr:hypothetical protein [Fimbriimonadaceae bacterium]
MPVRVSRRKGNVQGNVLILEYHRIGAKNSTWVRSAKSFRKDLSRLYELGYRPVTLSEYLENRMKLPSGASPVIITFDDSHISQLSIDRQGNVDPNCAVGIWQRFAAKRRTFPVKAVFFVLPPRPFGSGKSMLRKFGMLERWGCEIASHSLSHRPFAKLTEDEVKQEIAGSKDWLRSLGVDAKYLALPYGSLPNNRDLLEGFEYNGRRYAYDAVLLAGSGPALSPNSRRLRHLRLPRVQAIQGDYGIDYWLDRVKRGKSKPYVQP